MSPTIIDYNALLERSLHQVVQGALERMAGGSIGAHHFYIAFRTGAPGVAISDALRARHPDTMTVVLQHRYWGLEVDAQGFSVNLTFDGRPEWLRVPFAAITQFNDPSVNFGLKFPLAGPKPLAPHAGAGPLAPHAGAGPLAPHAGAGPLAPQAAAGTESKSPAEEKPAEQVGQIVSLDSFRKK